jgi:hypothetical protein
MPFYGEVFERLLSAKVIIRVQKGFLSMAKINLKKIAKIFFQNCLTDN